MKNNFRTKLDKYYLLHKTKLFSILICLFIISFSSCQNKDASKQILSKNSKTSLIGKLGFASLLLSNLGETRKIYSEYNFGETNEIFDQSEKGNCILNSINESVYLSSNSYDNHIALSSLKDGDIEYADLIFFDGYNNLENKLLFDENHDSIIIAANLENTELNKTETLIYAINPKSYDETFLPKLLSFKNKNSILKSLANKYLNEIILGLSLKNEENDESSIYFADIDLSLQKIVPQKSFELKSINGSININSMIYSNEEGIKYGGYFQYLNEENKYSLLGFVTNDKELNSYILKSEKGIIINSIFETEFGENLFCGSRINENNIEEPILGGFFDLKNKEIWIKNIGIIGNSYCKKIISDNYNDIYIIGAAIREDNYQPQAYILKISNNSTLPEFGFIKNSFDNTSSNFEDIVITPNDNLFALGSKTKHPKSDLIILNLNTLNPEVDCEFNYFLPNIFDITNEYAIEQIELFVNPVLLYETNIKLQKTKLIYPNAKYECFAEEINSTDLLYTTENFENNSTNDFTSTNTQIEDEKTDDDSFTHNDIQYGDTNVEFVHYFIGALGTLTGFFGLCIIFFCGLTYYNIKEFYKKTPDEQKITDIEMSVLTKGVKTTTNIKIKDYKKINHLISCRCCKKKQAIDSELNIFDKDIKQKQDHTYIDSYFEQSENLEIFNSLLGNNNKNIPLKNEKSNKNRTLSEPNLQPNNHINLDPLQIIGTRIDEENEEEIDNNVEQKEEKQEEHEQNEVHEQKYEPEQITSDSMINYSTNDALEDSLDKNTKIIDGTNKLNEPKYTPNLENESGNSSNLENHLTNSTD